MPDNNIDLGYAFNLPPEKAVAYFRRKGRRVSFDWHSMWKEAHATAFTVANCAKLDVLRDLQLGIRKALKEGKSEKWFVQTLEPVLRSKGLGDFAVKVLEQELQKVNDAYSVIEKYGA